jgi:hypothetical protein
MPLFYLVKVWPREAEREAEECEQDDDGNAVLYPDGATAAARAAEMNRDRCWEPDDEKGWFAQYGKIQPRVFAGGNDNWRDREATRFATGQYQPLPWADADWFKDTATARDHFAHVSTAEPGKLAFTEDATKGAADRQTRMRPGRYLEKYFPELGSEMVRTLAAEFCARYELNQLLFATTADDIERVYRSGPSSCMAHGLDYYNSPIHPVRVYAAGDLAVAYLKEGERITARVLCWPARKIYSRIYGDEERISYLLDAAGYTQGGDCCFDGAKLLREETDNGFVMPYVDWHDGAHDNGRHIILGGRGDITCESTCGVSEDGERFTCDNCGDRASADDAQHVRHNGTWCNSCVENCTVYSEYHGEQIAEGDAVRVGDDYVQEGSACYVTCEATGENYWEDGDGYVTLADGRVWSREYANENGYCDDDGDWYEGEKPDDDENAEQLEIPLDMPVAA